MIFQEKCEISLAPRLSYKLARLTAWLPLDLARDISNTGGRFTPLNAHSHGSTMRTPGSSPTIGSKIGVLEAMSSY